MASSRFYNLVGLILTFLLFVSSVAPTPGYAEAQMRCVGAPLSSAPCARAELPAGDMTEGQVYKTLMTCCRLMKSGCAMTRNGSMHSQASPQSHVLMTADRTWPDRTAFSARPCLVSLHGAVPVPALLAAHRLRWLFTSSPALAPPVIAPHIVSEPQTVRVAFWSYAPVLSPHSAPALHGLRAPPSA